MKSVIIYYSFSGNTRKVAEVLEAHLRTKGEVELIGLKPTQETKAFLAQCAQALRRVRTELEPVKFDLSEYKGIFLGTPVWAFAPVPALNTFLDKCEGVNGKHVTLFTTYGSGTGNQKCLDSMQNALTKKGVSNFSRFSIQQFKVKDNDFVLSEIRKAGI
ncbi:MAG: NAD(P)H-dependent oxidoreductase [Candidatus Omnitrophica bacterium]|nr:NAD(P)H-dependent oxidoreductase [Candidatus Omnitrophota bacterium]